MRPGNYTLVYDEFDGSGKHDLEVNYQFAPGRLEQPHEQGVLYDGRVEAVWIGNPAWRAQIRTGGPSPEDGWIAPSLGVRQSAPRLSLRSQFAQPKASILTLFAARQGTAPRVSLVSSAAVLRVMGPDYIDWIAAPRLTSGGPLQTDALVGVCRVRDGLPIETANMGGTYVQADAERLAQLGATIATAGGR